MVDHQGSCRTSDSVNFFRFRRADGRPEPKKFNEPAAAVADLLPAKSTAMAKLCVPPPSIPMTAGSLRFISDEQFILKTAVQTAKYAKYAKGKRVEWTKAFPVG